MKLFYSLFKIIKHSHGTNKINLTDLVYDKKYKGKTELY